MARKKRLESGDTSKCARNRSYWHRGNARVVGTGPIYVPFCSAHWGSYACACEPFLLGEGSVLSRDVLLLNSNYEPLNVCTMRRALGLMIIGKVEVLHAREEPLRTAGGPMEAPSVLRMRYNVRRPMPQLRLSRHSVLARDGYACQYCGLHGRELTIDHVVPRWAGGPNSWDNMVACCRRCNLKKGDKTPQQANMRLARRPRRPHYVPYLSLPVYLRARTHEEWGLYLPVFEGFSERLAFA